MLRSADTVRHSTETFSDTLLLFKPEALIDLAPQLGTKKDGNTGLALLHRLVVLENPVRLKRSTVVLPCYGKTAKLVVSINFHRLFQSLPGLPLQATSLRIHEILFCFVLF